MKHADGEPELSATQLATDWEVFGLRSEFPYIRPNSAIARIGVGIKRQLNSLEYEAEDFMDPDDRLANARRISIERSRYDLYEFMAKTLKYKIVGSHVSYDDEPRYDAIMSETWFESIEYQRTFMIYSPEAGPAIDNLRDELGIFFRLEARLHFRPPMKQLPPGNPDT